MFNVAQIFVQTSILQVSDIYKIKELTANDKKLFKKYESQLIALPARRRTFDERINSRVST